MAELTVTQRAVLTRRTRQLREATESLERGATRAVPKVRRLMQDIGGLAGAMGLPGIVHSVDVGHSVAANKLSVYARLLIEQLDGVLVE